MTAIITPFRIAWSFFWAILASVVLFVPISAAALLSRTGNLAFTLSKLWAYTMLGVHFVRREIVHRERIAPGQPYIIIANHQSLFDILALVTTLGIQYRWVIKREVLKVPLFGYALYASRNIFVDRSNTQKAIASIHRGLDRLPEGASVLIFAEGTRSRDGSIREFKKGGFQMAIARHIPILPVAVNGSRHVLPKDSFLIRPGRIRVAVGEPIDTTGCNEEAIPALMERTRSALLALYDPDYGSR
ncbi:MAG TPA: lysophospholipid acyltransferase family protein [Spirochaetota bacterium]|nr:lysophospholipid acyltransferase family protein [Spirochaetota bacterium]HNT09364.1 lysophospholipid acyltransferase family protein [Spirochaetota bacterium]